MSYGVHNAVAAGLKYDIIRAVRQKERNHASSNGSDRPHDNVREASAVVDIIRERYFYDSLEAGLGMRFMDYIFAENLKHYQ